MNQIKYPAQRTYYIVQNGSTHYGYVDPDQVMDSGHNEMQTFLVEQEWIDALALLDINPYQEEDLQNVKMLDREINYQRERIVRYGSIT